MESIRAKLVLDRSSNDCTACSFYVDYDYSHRRKSVTSKCTQTGIYPDILDCSLFHYCHRNKQHDVLRCPNGLNFDPKTFMCSTPQLVSLIIEHYITIIKSIILG